MNILARFVVTKYPSDCQANKTKGTQTYIKQLVEIYGKIHYYQLNVYEELGFSLRKLADYWYIIVSLRGILTTFPCISVWYHCGVGNSLSCKILWDLYMMIHPQTMRYFYKRQTLAPWSFNENTISHSSFQNSAWFNPPIHERYF